MKLGLLVLCSLLTIAYADRDDKKWVWSDNNRSRGRSAALSDPGSFDSPRASPRYEVYENQDSFDNYPSNEYNERPLNRPQFGGEVPFRPQPGLLPIERPGGVYAENNFGSGYGQGGGDNYPGNRPGPGILTGPIPSWQKEGPYKEFDRCKCSEKFNCNSPGISYGHCDVGKKYCCYSTSKKGQLGGPPPSRPVHSLENGILVGPGGPVDGGNNYPRPPLGPSGGYLRPANGGFGLGGRPRPSGFGGQNTYSAANGILVGPGGPFNRPNAGGYDDGFSPRSSSNRNDTD